MNTESIPRHPVTALWVHPRSMSTAVERIMRERGDLTCFHEPFMYYYYLGLGKKELPHSNLHVGNPSTLDGVMRRLHRAADARPVFFKDMAYYVLPGIRDYAESLGRWNHLALIRNPYRAVASYFRLDPEVSMVEIGLESQWRLYQWLSTACERAPLVIEAEAVQRDPFAAMRGVWDYLGLAFREQAFTWDEGATPPDWGPVSGWHGEVMASTGIRPVGDDDEDEAVREFEQAAARHPRLVELLEHHLPYYHRLRAVARSYQRPNAEPMN